jgi:hypothetical protein
VLKSRPKGFFSWDFVISEGNEEIAEVSLAWFRERGELSVKGEPCAIYREGLMGDFCLEWNGEVVARATKTSVWTRRFVVRFEGRELVLEAKSIFTRAFVLRDAGEGGKELGRISPASIFSRKAVIDLPEGVPLPVQVFMFWLVIILWRRAAKSHS